MQNFNTIIYRAVGCVKFSAKIRQLQLLLLHAIAGWLMVGSVYANLGIAFIHGTNDHRQDADGGYWKRAFINSLTKSLPNPDNHIILACDFSQYMWHEDAAGCLVNQLLNFIDTKQITNVIIYTHSNGANVLRWILSNPSYDMRYLHLSQKIAEVIAMAPSSAGTPLADEVLDGTIFEIGVGWLLGYHNDSVKQQRVGDMALFNAEMLLGTRSRPCLPVPFRVVVGSDVIISPFSKDSYCNGYFLNTSLKITQNFLSDCADGFLDCSSQAAAGTVWFYDVQKTRHHAPLNHNQSRHSCGGLAQILREDLQIRGHA